MIKSRRMTVDVETTGLDWTRDQLHGIGVGYEEDVSEYYPVWNIPSNILVDLANPKIPKIGHNLHAFDAKFIRKAGFEINGEFDDTMVLANIIDPDQPLGLKYLSDKHFGEQSLDNKRALDGYMSSIGVKNIAELCARDLLDSSHPHTEIIAKYCKEDVNNTTKLFYLFVQELIKLDGILKNIPFGFKKTPLDYYKEEARPLERVLFEMEYKGIRVDMSAVNHIKEDALSRMATLERKMNHLFSKRIPLVEKEIYEKAVTTKVTEAAKAKIHVGRGKHKYSWSNNNHFALLIYKYCDLDVKLIKHTEKGKYKTDKAALEDIRAALPAIHPLTAALKLYSEYKLQQKIATTYTGDSKKGILSKVRLVDGTHRIYPTYAQTSGTGRLKCKNPNMQNLKRDSEVKKFFIPDNEDEVFDDADYSQIELRTGAHLSQDVKLVSAYVEGLDVHLITASRLFDREISKEDDIERQAGKRTNFLTIFDGKAGRLQAALKADTGQDFTIAQCKEFIKIWFETYPDVRAYLDAQLQFFKQYRFCISETGRIRRLPDICYGDDINWEKLEDGRWQPYYYGTQKRRNTLIHNLFKKNKQLSKSQVTDEMIGWQAYKQYSHAIKAGYNAPIQGLAASMTKRAMIRLYNCGRIITNQVHDSLVVPRKKWDLDAKKQTLSIMENVYPLSIPVVADCKTLTTFHPKDKAL